MNARQGGGGRQSFAMDYIDVATRLVEFREKHPEGALQPADLAHPYRIEQIGGETYIVVVAAAYRGADDARPGIGMAYEQFPGRTPYTKGSELQNAETSAWGRAIVAALAADTRQGIASAEEVRNRVAEREQPREQSLPPKTAALDAARLATQSTDVERLRRTLAAANENGLAALDVAEAVAADLRASAGVPTEGALTLRDWLTACGKYVVAHHASVAAAIEGREAA
jgi:hypothetical protein